MDVRGDATGWHCRNDLPHYISDACGAGGACSNAGGIGVCGYSGAVGRGDCRPRRHAHRGACDSGCPNSPPAAVVASGCIAIYDSGRVVCIGAGRIGASRRVIVRRPARRRSDGPIAGLSRSGIAVLIGVGGIAAIGALIVGRAGSGRAGVGCSFPIDVRRVAASGVGVGTAVSSRVRRTSAEAVG